MLEVALAVQDLNLGLRHHELPFRLPRDGPEIVERSRLVEVFLVLGLGHGLGNDQAQSQIQRRPRDQSVGPLGQRREDD